MNSEGHMSLALEKVRSSLSSQGSISLVRGTQHPLAHRDPHSPGLSVQVNHVVGGNTSPGRVSGSLIHIVHFPFAC